MASMAATSSTLLHGAAAAGASLSVRSRKVMPSYSGLKMCPLVIKQAVAASSRSAARRFFTISCESSPDETLKQCQSVVAEQLGIELTKVQADSKFADLGADSLDTVEIVMALEEKFNISVEQDGAEKIVTVKDAADVIHKLVLQKNTSA